MSAAKTGGFRSTASIGKARLLAVEAPGQTPPLAVFGDRKLRRSTKPIRPGVYLWAVERQDITPALPEPIAATPLVDGEAR
ncbi:hypothetical protein ACRAWD_10805 [Caulobacter segnis]